MSGHGALHLWLSSQRTPRLVAGDFLQELTLLRLARLPGFAVIMAMYLMVLGNGRARGPNTYADLQQLASSVLHHLGASALH